MRSCSSAVKIFVHVSMQLLSLNYLFICTQCDDESTAPCSGQSRAVCGNLLCASLPISSADPTFHFLHPTWPWAALGAAGPGCAVLGRAERCCCVLWGGWDAPLARHSTCAVCWSEVKAVIHKATMLFLPMLSCTLMSLS